MREGESKSSVDLVKLYLREIGQYPLLTAEQEQEYGGLIKSSQEAAAELDQVRQGTAKRPPEYLEELATKIDAGDTARQIMINHNLRLVVSVARKYSRGNTFQLLDLIQEGNVGLMNAVEKFDADMGFKFSTYATWWIRQAITRSIADKSRTIRVPVHLGELIGQIRNKRRELETNSNTPVTREQIAERMGIAVSKIVDLEEVDRVTGNMLSLDSPYSTEDDYTLMDTIEDGSDFTEEVSTKHWNEELWSLVERTLPRREMEILALRMKEGKTLQECGELYGITRERVRQIEGKAIAKIKLALLRNPGLIRQIGYSTQELWPDRP